MPMRVVHGAVVATACVLLACGGAEREQKESAAWSFATPEAAVAAFVAALEKNNTDELESLLGPGTKGMLSSGDEVADRNARQSFLQRYRDKHQLVAGGPDDLALQVGHDDWPLPIPLVRRNGRWSFDGAAGAEELVMRRIGANELRVIAVMHGYVDAQQEYASAGRDGGEPGVFAQRLRSDPGKQDGLYWETAPGQPHSPLGPFVAAAAEEGYTASGSSQGAATQRPYHGYRYRMLFSQGDAASGGAHDYIVDGKLKDGFALVAFPDSYGKSGVMTFMVNQDGVVWQRDLGEETPKVAAAMKQFNPDPNWTPIASEG
ncbi:MAG TPA: DUF2950 domain-containing protein [Steroidobacteraceae bacterium]|nr:DUF2950 domain-containing protein [Steroidobacteraceae bacterium]